MTEKIDFLSKPFAVNVHDEHNLNETVCLALSYPYQHEGKLEIGLIILGKFSEAVLERLVDDFLAGIAVGHFQLLCEIQKEKAKKDPQGLFIKSFAYQEYAFAYQEVINYGASVAVTLFQEKYFREQIQKVTNNDKISWGEKEKKHLLRINEEDFSGTAIISYCEKEPKSVNWIVPIEVTKIWQHLLVFNNEQAEELAVKLLNAMKKGGKDLKKIETEILTFVNK